MSGKSKINITLDKEYNVKTHKYDPIKEDCYSTKDKLKKLFKNVELTKSSNYDGFIQCYYKFDTE